MSLKRYQEKRNFSSSPEPEGDETRARKKRKGQQPFFCVQKHLASHLHYDFRLEHNGVLLSWAVPKGPSLDPKVKRFAAQVEDHPLEYGSFEGVIPGGYGAGIVMLWDSGTWTTQSPDVDAALKKGDLKFTLDGYKLKGSWVLVRTRGYDRGTGESAKPSWLLIKHRDEWSGDLDITEFAPLSVKSGEDFPAIMAAQDPALWLSHRPEAAGATGAILRGIIEQAAELKLASLSKADSKTEKTKRARPKSGPKTRPTAQKKKTKKATKSTSKKKPSTS